MGYTVGTKVSWSTKNRKLKEGVKESNYKRSATRLINKHRSKDIDINTFFEKLDKLKDKFYHKDLFETKSGISIIESRHNFSNKEWHFTLKNVDGVFLYDELLPFVKNTNIAKFLNECTKTQSCLTRSGELYYHNDILIMEHVTSTGNVWIDEAFAKRMSKDEWNDFKEEVRYFLHKVRNVYDIDLSGHIKERDEIFNKIFMEYFGYSK